MNYGEIRDYRMKLIERYNLKRAWGRGYSRFLTAEVIVQLHNCKTEAARRLLLGVSK